MSDKIEARNTIYAHKNNVHNLNEKNQNELERIKLNHEKRKAQISNQHTEELLSARNNQHKEVIEQAAKHERVLEKMQKSIADVKDRADAKKLSISQEMEGKLAASKLRFHEKLAQEKSTQEMVMGEVNQKGNIELQRLQRQIEQKDAQLKHMGRQEAEAQKVQHQNQLSMTKQTYALKKNAAEDKYNTALNRKLKEHSTTLANEERKFQKALMDRTGNYQKEMRKAKSDGDNKKIMAKAQFEKSFKNLMQEHEKSLGDLSGKKQAIIQKLKNEIIDAYRLDVARASDPFYSTTTIEPEITETDNAYVISLPVNEADAGSVVINGHKREITLALNRRFENTRQDDGATEKVKKVETLTRTFNVDKIVDINKVEKSYADGVLSFKVAFA